MELSLKTAKGLLRKLTVRRVSGNRRNDPDKITETTNDVQQLRVVTHLNFTKHSDPTINPCDGFTPDGSTHTRTINSTEAYFQVTDVFQVGSDQSQEAEFVWVIPAVYSVIKHGHGFEFLLGNEKVADLYIKSNSPIRLHVDNGRQSCGNLERATAQNQFLLVTVESNNGFINTEINFENFKYTNRNLIGGSEAWSQYQADVGLNYLLKTTNHPVGSKYLLVGFAAMRPLGDFTYNYKASLENIDANTVFILDDFGDQGAYYYADHGSLGIYRSVQSLLRGLSETLGVPMKNMILFGSSKGGTAALLHGISAGVGHVYVGAPQTKIGTFVRKPHPNVLELITGGTSDQDVERLDSVLFEYVGKATMFPKTTVIVGNADHHYKNHAVPFVDFSSAHGHDVNLKVLNGVPHSEIGHKYRTLLHGYITRVIANHKES